MSPPGEHAALHFAGLYFFLNSTQHLLPVIPKCSRILRLASSLAWRRIDRDKFTSSRVSRFIGQNTRVQNVPMTATTSLVAVTAGDSSSFSMSVDSGNSLRLDYSRRVLAQLCALRTHDVRALFSLERLSSAALFQETMVCSLGNNNKKKKKSAPPHTHTHTFAPPSQLNTACQPLARFARSIGASFANTASYYCPPEEGYKTTLLLMSQTSLCIINCIGKIVKASPRTK